MDKGNVVVYTMECYSAFKKKKKMLSFVTADMSF